MFKLFMSDIYPNNAARIRSKGTGLFIKSFTFTKQKQNEGICLFAWWHLHDKFRLYRLNSIYFYLFISIYIIYQTR